LPQEEVAVRRWNGWGHEGSVATVPAGALRLLEAEVGPAEPHPDAALADVVAAVPDSRLPNHPLISLDPEDRVRHARGQSLPDWIALRSGRLEAVPDGVAHPTDAGEVRELLAFAATVGASVIPFKRQRRTRLTSLARNGEFQSPTARRPIFGGAAKCNASFGRHLITLGPCRITPVSTSTNWTKGPQFSSLQATVRYIRAKSNGACPAEPPSA
jgi:hypothetical protein